MPTPVSKRRLIYFPIVHTPADMGALAGAVETAEVKKVGREGWKRNVQMVDRLWTAIEDAVFGLKLDFEGVRIYQDGLPQCGAEREIVAELAKAGSRNHKLLRNLEERGAILMGTECPELLLEEYRLMSEVHGPGHKRIGSASEASRRAAAASLLNRRDKHIAGCINRTLKAGDTGILFLGLLHDVAPLVEKDIEVYFPVLKLTARTTHR